MHYCWSDLKLIRYYIPTALRAAITACLTRLKLATYKCCAYPRAQNWTVLCPTGVKKIPTLSPNQTIPHPDLLIVGCRQRHSLFYRFISKLR